MPDTEIIDGQIVITTIAPEVVSITEILQQGPEGPAGPSTVSNSIQKIAGSILSGHRVVMIDSDGKAYYADHDTDSHIHKILGVTKGATLQDAVADIQTYGEMVEPTWAWDTSSPIFLGNNGLLVQSGVASGFLLEIGFPTSATSIFINIKDPIILA